MTKIADIIIVGGTIAAGKSTLVENLAKFENWNAVPELREGDKVQEIILSKLYEGKRLHMATVQYYFITNRYKQYEDCSKEPGTSILDRGIWEDWIFSKLLMENAEPKSYEHYKDLWKTTIEKVVAKFGLPKAYIYLKVDWDTFRTRIYKRNREAEIANFSRNEEYFKGLLHEYNENFVPLLQQWGIEPIVVDTVKLNRAQVTEEVIKQLRERKLID